MMLPRWMVFVTGISFVLVFLMCLFLVYLLVPRTVKFRSFVISLGVVLII